MFFYITKYYFTVQLHSASCMCMGFLYLPMFFILIFASGGISSGSLCATGKSKDETLAYIYIYFLLLLTVKPASTTVCTYIIIFIENRCQSWLFRRDWWDRFFGFLEHKMFDFFLMQNSNIKWLINFIILLLLTIWYYLKETSVTVSCHTLTVAPSLMDMGFDFFPIWLLMPKPILEILQGAGGFSEASSSSSSSGMRCWDVRLNAVPSPPTVLQEIGLVFTLPSSSCGPAWGKTTHRGEQQFPVKPMRIKSFLWHLYLCA